MTWGVGQSSVQAGGAQSSIPTPTALRPRTHQLAPAPTSSYSRAICHALARSCTIGSSSARTLALSPPHTAHTAAGLLSAPPPAAAAAAAPCP